MFTGIVQAKGRVRSTQERAGDLELVIDSDGLDWSAIETGESIAVSGCCLTVTRLADSGFAADVSRETLALTTLGRWSAGRQVNLERAVLAGQPLGGHYVTGHVDCVGEVISCREDARSLRVEFGLPPELAKYVARKGSIAVDGVSLTVNDVAGARFSVNLVPHTLEVTTLQDCRPGVLVNIEIDIIARYVERLSSAGEAEWAGLP